MEARYAAVKALGAYRRGKALPRAALDAITAERGMTQIDTALAMQILYGVIRNIAYCDYIASSFSSIMLGNLQPQVLDILRASIYQIIFLDRIPHSAAVNEGVKLAAKLANPKAAGYVNALLRRVAESSERGLIPEVADEDERKRLSVRYSHPEWLTRELFELLGRDGAEKFLRMNNNPVVSLSAQVNTLLTDTGSVLEMLLADGIDAAPHEWLEDCIVLKNTGRISHMEAYIKGFMYIQDAAARLAVIAAEPHPGDIVIDACAAPGGKSFASALIMRNTGRLIACDIKASKLSKITEGAERLKLSIIECVEKYAMHIDESLVSSADVVLADVPCSGIGVIRRKPDIRYKPYSEINELPTIQKNILFNLASYVKPGGTLLYSTCTVLMRENEEVIEEFLALNPEFSPAEFTLPKIGFISDGMVTLWPQTHGVDGFFICRLKRNVRG